MPRKPDDDVRDRAMEGETPLQAIARRGEPPRSRMRSIERFPYYTAFPFGWYRAVFTEQLAVGEVKPLHYLNRDLVVWRDEEGAPHVIDAYCPHLGAHLGYGGRVEGCELVCPFHWWRWGTDGRNTRIPYDGSRNPAARIETYPTRECNDTVLFWYHPTGEAPLWDVPSVDTLNDDAWTEYDRYTWHLPIPWQEFAENGPDFVHLRTVHGAVDVPELEAYEMEGYESRVRSKVNFDTPRGPAEGRIDSDAWGPGFSVARFSGIIDACFVAASTPVDFETLEVTHSYKIRKLGETPELLEKTQRVGAALVRDLVKQVEEDAVIFQQKICQMKPQLSKVDGPIVRFREWASRFYVEGDPRAVNR